MSKNNKTKSKNSKKPNNSLFPRENMQAVVNEAIDTKIQDSKRLREASVKKRSIDQNYSAQRNQPGPSGQVPVLSVG